MGLLRLMLPPSNARLDAAGRAQLVGYLSAATGMLVEVEIATSYDGLARQLLSGAVTAAWAPPFACARLEKVGVPILLRSLRKGRASYRAALIAAKGSSFGVDDLAGKRAAWVDHESTGGYLLAAAYLRSRGATLERLFASQHFAGSYPAALQAVLGGAADVTSVFAPPAGAGDATGLSELLPGREAELRTLAFTDESPNDGIALAPLTPKPLGDALEKALVGAASDAEGRVALERVFKADGFERATANGYQALYLSVRTLR